jgi:hypothetical protein
MLRRPQEVLCVLGLLACEEHQYVAIDPRATDGAALDVASGLEYFLERRHARLPHEENENRKAEYDAGGFATLGPGGHNFRCRSRLSPSLGGAMKLAR